jgi:hypothetical protein
MVEATSYKDLSQAGEDLAGAVQKVGLDRWPRFLATAAKRSTAAISDNEVPGVVKVGMISQEMAERLGLGGGGLGLGIGIGGGGIIGGGLAIPRRSPATTAPALVGPVILNAGSLPPPKEGETASDVMRPNGQWVGDPAENSGVHQLPGGKEGAEALFDRLTKGKGGQDITPEKYPGTLIKLLDGSYIGYRPKSKSGPPSIDVTLPGLNSHKWKFPSGYVK